METAESILLDALRARRDGRNGEAERLFRVLVQKHPKSPEAAEAETYLAQAPLSRAPSGRTPVAGKRDKPTSRAVGTPPPEVTVVDVDIPFMRLVWLTIKLALASIPAIVILLLLALVLFNGLLARLEL
jgi:hypothetical protein